MSFGISNNNRLDLYVDYLTGAQSGKTNTNFSEDELNILGIEQGETVEENYDEILDEYLEYAKSIGMTEEEALAEVGLGEGVEETKAAEATTATTAASGASSEEIQAQIDKLEEEKAENLEKMSEIEDHIEDLADEAEDQIAIALQEQDDAVKEHEKEVKEALDKNIQDYINANKDGGEGMTRDELQQNIAGSLPDMPEVAEAMAALTNASELVDEIDNCLGDLNKLIANTKAIDDLIETKQGEYEAAVKAEEEAKCCDPIGFTTTDKDGNQAQYDFIVDDGAFDSTSDFLGAENQWAEMAALDTTGDGIVDADELAAGNIKAVKTDANGNQSVVDIAEEFGKDFSIDLNSYKEGGSHSAVDTNSDADGDGVNDQTLLGTFNLNINGQSVSGYNTLDDVDWLADNYDGLEAGEQAELSDSNRLDPAEYSAEVQPHVTLFNFYTELNEEFKKEIAQGYEQFGIDEENLKELHNITKDEADEKAKEFRASIGLEDEDNNNKTEENKAEGNGVVDTANLTEEERKRLGLDEAVAA